MARRLRRVTRAAFAFAVLSFAPSCFFVGPDLLRTQEDEVSRPDFLEISLVVTGPGGDAVDVYLEGSITGRIRIAEIVANRIGMSSPVIEGRAGVDNLSTVRARSSTRLVRRTNSGWSLTIDTQPLQQSLLSFGHPGFDVVICHPAVEAEFSANREPDYEAFASTNSSCLQGFGWSTVISDPLHVTLLLRPETGIYILYILAWLAGLALLSAAAWFLGRRLRRGPFRRRNAAAVAIGLVAGGIAAAGLAFAVGMSGALFGPPITSRSRRISASGCTWHRSRFRG